MNWEPRQKGLCPKVFNLKQCDRQAITIKQHKVESREHGYQSCQNKGAQFSFLLVGPNELQPTMPPSSSRWPVWKSGILPFVICQITIVNHDIHRVKFQEVSTLTQNVFEDCPPVRVSNLTSSFILQRCSSTEFGTWVTCNKIGSRIEATSPSGVPPKLSTKSITQQV